MKRQLTDQQQWCVQTILSHMKEYLDLRFQMSIRSNPRFESPWPDLQFLLLAQLRNTLENDKMWGPIRYVIGEILCGSDKGKIRDCFSATHQSSIQSEVVERTDKAGHKTSDVLEIHDFKTLYSAMDAAIANIASVIQIYMWWDLPDAADIARFYHRAHRFTEISKKGANEATQQHYARLIRRPVTQAGAAPPENEAGLPTQEEILDFEALQLRDAMDSFCERRAAEPGYKLILARRSVSNDGPADQLIATLAREQVLMVRVERGEPLEEGIRAHLAQALGMAPDELQNEAIATYLREAISDGKRRLLSMMRDSMGGEVYNYKANQGDAMRRAYHGMVGDRHERLLRKEEEDRAAVRTSQEAVPKL